MYIAVRIHNNSLGRCVECPDGEAEAKDIIRGWAEEQFGRPLTEEEIKGLEDSMDIYNEEDADNIYCFSIGITE